MTIRVSLPTKPSSRWKPNDKKQGGIPEIPESILSLGIWKPGVTGWVQDDGTGHPGPK